MNAPEALIERAERHLREAMERPGDGAALTKVVTDMPLLIEHAKELRKAVWLWRHQAWRLGNEVPGNVIDRFFNRYMYPAWREANRLLAMWSPPAPVDPPEATPDLAEVVKEGGSR